MAEVAPLPLSEAEKIFLAHLLGYRKKARVKKLSQLQTRLDDLSPSEEEFEFFAKLVRQVSYTVAMCDVIGERLGIDIDNPPSWKPDEDEPAIAHSSVGVVETSP